MDFGGVLRLEGFVGPESGGVVVSSDNPDATRGRNNNNNSNRSGFLKQERSGCDDQEEDEWRRNSKAPRTESVTSAVVDAPKATTMLHHQYQRSNSLLSGDDGGHSQNNMLSFSSPKSEVTFLSKNGGLVGGTTQNPVLPCYQLTPSAYTRNAGYGSGGFNGGMQGPFPGIKGPFTPSQWIELEHQALIYKYIVSAVPVPSNLLIALKKSLNPFGLAGSSSGSFVPNSLGWGSFHLGYGSNTDPEPGRCRRTDGKKWRCSRDAVPDQKYCERHINRGRHRSRKHVEGQTGHAVSSSTKSNVAPGGASSSVSASSVLSSGGGGGTVSNSFSITQHQLKGLQQPGASTSPTETPFNRMQDHQGLSVVSPTVNLKSKDSPFAIPKQHIPLEPSSQSEFGLVPADSLLNPSQKSSYTSSRNYTTFLDFTDHETDNQNPLRRFVDDPPKNQTNRGNITWPDELKSDWTQLSMSIMASSDFSSRSSSPTRDKLSVSPLRLSRDFDPIQMGLGVGTDLTEPNQKNVNSLPISWGNPMGGPLGEVLNSTSSFMGASKNSSALNLRTQVWDGSPQLGSSPTGVLQRTTFVSLSNSSSGSSPRADSKKNHDGASFCADVFGSTLASSFSLPSL